MNAAAVAEGDVPGEPGSDPVDSRQEALNDPDAAEVREDFVGVAAAEGYHP